MRFKDHEQAGRSRAMFCCYKLIYRILRQISRNISPALSSSFSSYTFNTQILCNNDSRLLSNSYRSVISISSYIAWCDTEVWKKKVSNMYQGFAKVVVGALPAIFKFCTPYTFSLSSTTPPCSRGFIAHVPI